MVEDDLKIPDEGGKVPKFLEGGWQFHFEIMKYPLYLTDYDIGLSASCLKNK